MVEKRVTGTSRRATNTVSLWELKKEIDERAHQIYLDRIASHEQGDELSDWLRAEAEIEKKHKL
jgi:hypothetical protein